MQRSAGTPTIVVVGSINADLVLEVDRFPGPGETLHGRGGRITSGGKGANQAVAAALQGGAVTMIGAVGDDANAGPALELLRRSGVDVGQVPVIPGPTGLAIVSVDAAGENTIVVIPGANAAMDAAAVESYADAVGAADVVILQGEIPLDGIAAAARLARGRLLLNLAPVCPVDPDVIRRADPLVVNEHEGVGALGLLDADAPPAGGEEAVVGALVDAGLRSVVMTLGARGALVHDGASLAAVASPRVTPVDSTGAGDAFVGALAVRLGAGDPLRDAAAHACRVGAFAVTRPGAQTSYPGPDDALPGEEAR